MIVLNADFAQEEFPGLILDFSSECNSDELPGKPSIVAFPRDPKPHEVTDKAWVKQHWV